MYDIDDDKCEHYNGKAMETGSLFMMEGPTKEKKKHAVLGTSCLYIITINYRFKVWKHTHTEYT